MCACARVRVTWTFSYPQAVWNFFFFIVCPFDLERSIFRGVCDRAGRRGGYSLKDFLKVLARVTGSGDTLARWTAPKNEHFQQPIRKSIQLNPTFEIRMSMSVELKKSSPRTSESKRGQSRVLFAQI